MKSRQGMRVLGFLAVVGLAIATGAEEVAAQGCCVCDNCAAPQIFYCQAETDEMACMTACTSQGCAFSHFDTGVLCTAVSDCFGDCCQFGGGGCAQQAQADCMSSGDLYFANSFCDGDACVAAPPTTTATPSDTPTQTASATITDTATATATATETQTPTETPSDTPTETPTPSPSATLTDTATATESPTSTPTQTPTVTPTITATGTATLTATSTLSPTITATATQTPTPTPVVPMLTGGVTPGSSRVEGHGEPDEPNDCIQTCLIGGAAFRVPSDPPCTAPDSVIGMGRTDAQGRFVDNAGTLGIPVSPPLGSHVCIYPFDRCLDGGTIGPVACAIGPAPAPTLTTTMLAAAVGALILIGLLALPRRRRGAANPSAR